MPSKREMITPVLVRTGAAKIMRGAMPWAGVMTLNYHRIGDGSKSDFDRGLWSADEEQFDRQLKFVKKNFDVIGAGDLPEVCRRRKGRNLMITFDDGYLDNFKAAFPILKRNGVPAIFFIATGFIDHPSLPWWDEIAWMVRTSRKSQLDVSPWIGKPVELDEPDRERTVRTLLKAFKAMPTEKTTAYLDAVSQATGTGRCTAAQSKNLWVTWDMIRQMKIGGMTIGGHTVHHPILGRMTPEGQWSEISGCAARIREELGEPMKTFSYPVGHVGAFNDVTRECLEKAGVEYGFSYYAGVSRFDKWDKYDIRRLPIDNDLSFDHFKAIVMVPQMFGRAETAG